MHEKENKNNVDMNMLRRFSSVKLIGNFFGAILLLSKKKFEKRSHNKVKYTNYDRYTVYILVSIYVEEKIFDNTNELLEIVQITRIRNFIIASTAALVIPEILFSSTVLKIGLIVVLT